MRIDWAETPDSPHSWVVAAVGAVAMVFTFGTPLSYGILRQPFSDAFGISPVALSPVFAVMLFAFFIGSGLVGIFGGRFRTRAILLACALATGLLGPALYLVDSIVGLALVFAVLGLALGTEFVLVASVVPRWFDARRGAATGLIFVGNGLGLFLLPPAWQLAIAEVGVREGFLLIFAATAVAFFGTALTCRRPAWAETTTDTVGELVEWLTGLAASRQFQLLFFGVAMAFAWYQLLAAYAVDLFAYRGLSATSASTAFGLIGGVSIVSRMGSGYLADRIGTRRAFIGSLLSAIAGLAVLFVPTRWAVTTAVLLLGLGLGATATLYIPLLLGIYSPEMDTAIVGVFNVAAGITALVMPSLGTASATYADGFALAIGITLVVTVLGTAAVTAGTVGE